MLWELHGARHISVAKFDVEILKPSLLTFIRSNFCLDEVSPVACQTLHCNLVQLISFKL